MKNKITAFVIVLGILFIPASGKEKKISISFKGGYYSPSSSTFNNESIPPTSRMFTDMISILSSAGLSADYDELEKMRGRMTFGAEFELYVWRQFSVALGAEYWNDETSASLQGLGDIGTTHITFNYEFRFKAFLFPILGTLRYNFPLGRFRGYVGAGGGYYIGEIKSRWKTPTTEEMRISARGSTFIPHLNGGVDFYLTSKLSVAVDVRYVFGKIESFRIKWDSDERREGQMLTFADENGKHQTFQWELSGFNAGLFLRFRF